MNIAVEHLPDCKAKLTIEIGPDIVESERKGLVRAFASQAKLPGYRPGKIPAAVVEKKFAAQINEELTDRLMRRAWAEADEKENLGILGVAGVERQMFEADGAFSLVAEVVTQPQIDLPDYGEIPVEVPKLEVTDENIDNVLERMRQNFAEFEDVEGRALRKGDVAVISYAGFLEDRPLSEIVEEEQTPLAASDEYWVKVPESEEDRSFLPGFGEQLEGLEIDGEKEVAITLPEDLGVEALDGKDVRYEVTVTGIKEQQLPEIDDELAGKVEEGKTLEEVRESIKAQMEVEQENQRRELITNQILNHLTGSAEFELPEHILFNETQRHVNQMVMQGYQSGMGQEQIEESQEDILNSASARAKSSVKATFLLEKIAEKEDISVSDDELSRQVMMMAAQSGRPVKKFARELRERNGFGEIRHDLLISKVLEFLRGNVSVTEVDPPAETDADGEPESGDSES